jgi:predicted amidohydrolase YtcJ
MAADLILKASTIITMEDDAPRAEALAVDSSTGRITSIGSLADVQAAAPGVSVTDLGDTVLMPGFIEPHSHPLVSGMATQPPAYWIAPYVGCPSWNDVVAKFAEVDKELPAGQIAIFNGLDRLLQQAPLVTREVLDPLFPSGRPVAIMDNSGHAVYFNTGTINALGWADLKAPSDPVGGSYGREADGVTSNGTAYESGAVFAIVGALFPKAIPHPLQSGAQFYRYMASFGVTSTSEHTYNSGQYKGYAALAGATDCPLRVHIYHMSIEPDAAEQITFPDPAMVRKNGIKLWADGSPWLGNVANSFPYLETQRVKDAEIIIGPLYEKGMNYTRGELDQILDQFVPLGYQMAFHCNGDVGFDVVLDAYEHALQKYELLGTDHRWRVEHLGAARGEQFKRAASLGVTVSMSPFQFLYWGELLDGTMFAPEIGSRWQAVGDAIRGGCVVSFHNDGSVAPPNQLLAVQGMVTRMTHAGTFHGPDQMIGLHDGLKAITINGAWQLKREDDIGSLKVGKYADLVELSTDPYTVDPHTLVESVKVQGTWLGGRKLDLDAFMADVAAIDPTEHQDLHNAAAAVKGKCC